MKNKIRDLRKREGLTQQALASAVGCNTRQIQKFENGECDLANMTLGMAFRISAALCVDVYDLIDEDVQKDRAQMQKDVDRLLDEFSADYDELAKG